MRKAFIGVLAGGVVAGAGLGLTATASATVAVAPSGSTTLSFTSHPTSNKVFHLGSSKAFGVGYVEPVAGNDMQGSTKIGHDDSVQTVTRLSGGTADEVVTITFVLAGGQINTMGVVTSTPSGRHVRAGDHRRDRQVRLGPRLHHGGPGERPQGDPAHHPMTWRSPRPPEPGPRDHAPPARTRAVYLILVGTRAA